jgi:hypothetical protein
MRRFQLIEIHELSFCPAVLRNGLTNFLEIAIDTLDSYSPIRDHLQKALIHSGSKRIVDLCSGAGGPWTRWLRQEPIHVELILTDKYPNLEACQKLTNDFRSNVSYCRTPVDATAVPSHLSGFRTLFSSFHHFKPEKAKAIIADAVDKNQPIGIFEYTHRSWKNLASMLLLTFLGVWLLTPRIRNVSWITLLFTYPIPLIPLITTIDGLVSCLRTYNAEELTTMANAHHYVWQIGTEKRKGSVVTYLIGYPASAV